MEDPYEVDTELSKFVWTPKQRWIFNQKKKIEKGGENMEDLGIAEMAKEIVVIDMGMYESMTVYETPKGMSALLVHPCGEGRWESSEPASTLNVSEFRKETSEHDGNLDEIMGKYGFVLVHYDE